MNLRDEQLELKDLNYPLYLCSAFASLSQQPVLQDLLSLSCHLTHSVTQPSEQILKAVRIQWWTDCISDGQRFNSPLSDRLLKSIENGQLDKQTILHIISKFQLAAFEDTPEEILEECWADIFSYYYTLIGKTTPQILSFIQLLAKQVCSLLFFEKTTNYNVLKKELKRISSKKNREGFLKALCHLIQLSNRNKFRNFRLLPIRLFVHMMFGKI
ncbi:MAG: hypothetical protein HOI17_08230 [Alphaproteobacteria bacterium]|nr:hypothetical protein [Alphaproteobacteria bacterium]